MNEDETYVSIVTAKLLKYKYFNYKPEYYYFPNDNRDGYGKVHKNFRFPNSPFTLEQDYIRGYYTLVLPCPSLLLCRKWLQEKYGIYIELIIDGWQDDNCVKKDYICYRLFIWQIGKPKPLPHEDFGAGEYEKMLEIGLYKGLELI